MSTPIAIADADITNVSPLRLQNSDLLAAMSSINLSLAFRLTISLPTAQEHADALWQVAQLLKRYGLPEHQWHPPADTPQASIALQAFEPSGATHALVDAALQAEKDSPNALVGNWRSLGVWNGLEKEGAAAFDLTLSTMPGSPCTLTLQTKSLPSLDQLEPLIELLRGLISTWPWPVTMASIGPTRYFALHQVFKDRLGAGWILYLPQIIAEDALPASAGLFPVSRAETQLGTLIASVCDAVFDVRNPAHIQAANAIEVSLADRDLLPLHTAL